MTAILKALLRAIVVIPPLLVVVWYSLDQMERRNVLMQQILLEYREMGDRLDAATERLRKAGEIYRTCMEEKGKKGGTE